MWLLASAGTVQLSGWQVKVGFVAQGGQVCGQAGGCKVVRSGGICSGSTLVTKLELKQCARKSRVPVGSCIPSSGLGWPGRVGMLVGTRSGFWG